MKDRYELAKKLEELPELYRQANELFSSDRDLLGKLGLITPEEELVLRKADLAHSQISDAKSEAEEAVPLPDQTTAYPPEYARLLARQNEIRTMRNQFDTVSNSLRCLLPKTWYGMHNIATRINLCEVAEKLCNKLMKELPDPLSNESPQVDRSIDARQRKGSKVRQIRTELFNIYTEERQLAGGEATKVATAKNQDILSEEQDIKNLIATRQREKLQPIKEQIKVLLEKALEA